MTHSAPPARVWNAIRDQSPCLAGMAAVIVPVATFFLATTPIARLLGQVDRALNATMPALSHGIARTACTQLREDQAATVRAIHESVLV